MFVLKDSYQCLKKFSDFEPKWENSSVESLFMFKDSHKCLREFSAFGPQQEFSVGSLFVLKDSCQCWFSTPIGKILWIQFY